MFTSCSFFLLKLEKYYKQFVHKIATYNEKITREKKATSPCNITNKLP